MKSLPHLPFPSTFVYFNKKDFYHLIKTTTKYLKIKMERIKGKCDLKDSIILVILIT